MSLIECMVLLILNLLGYHLRWVVFLVLMLKTMGFENVLSGLIALRVYICLLESEKLALDLLKDSVLDSSM